MIKPITTFKLSQENLNLIDDLAYSYSFVNKHFINSGEYKDVYRLSNTSKVLKVVRCKFRPFSEDRYVYSSYTCDEVLNELLFYYALPDTAKNLFAAYHGCFIKGNKLFIIQDYVEGKSRYSDNAKTLLKAKLKQARISTKISDVISNAGNVVWTSDTDFRIIDYLVKPKVKAKFDLEPLKKIILETE